MKERSTHTRRWLLAEVYVLSSLQYVYCYGWQAVDEHKTKNKHLIRRTCAYKRKDRRAMHLVSVTEGKLIRSGALLPFFYARYIQECYEPEDWMTPENGLELSTRMRSHERKIRAKWGLNPVPPHGSRTRCQLCHAHGNSSKREAAMETCQYIVQLRVGAVCVFLSSAVVFCVESMFRCTGPSFGLTKVSASRGTETFIGLWC